MKTAALIVASSLLAFGVSAQAQEVSTCEKLKANFDQNEKTYAVLHRMWSGVLETDRQYGTRYDIATARLKVEKTDEKFKAEGDRLVELMKGHDCPLPDHVTSPLTYAKQD